MAEKDLGQDPLSLYEKAQRALTALEGVIDAIKKNDQRLVKVSAFERGYYEGLYGEDGDPVLKEWGSEVFASASAAYRGITQERQLHGQLRSDEEVDDSELVMLPGGEIIKRHQLTQSLFENSLAEGPVLFLRDLDKETLEKWIDGRKNKDGPPDSDCFCPEHFWDGYLRAEWSRPQEMTDRFAETVNLLTRLAVEKTGDGSAAI